MKNYYVLNDVGEKTYSSHLIRANTNVNLHDFFKIRPTWFNRSTFKCRINNGGQPPQPTNIVMVYFKHAKPLDTIKMVVRNNTSVNVKKMLKCVFTTKKMNGGEINRTTAAIGTTIAAVAAYKTHEYYKTMRSKKEQHAKNLKIEQKQTSLNNNCLNNVKKRIGERSTHQFTIRSDCHAQFGKKKISVGTPLGSGAFGKIYSVDNHDDLAIKEQKGLCYLFINEINCLQKLKDENLTPKIFDAYICFTNTITLDNVTNEQVLYGYVMERFEMNLLQYLNTYRHDLLERGDVILFGNQILNILLTLDQHQILHRDLLIDNFMLDKNNHLKIIDFGMAYDLNDKDSETYYPNPFLKPPNPDESNKSQFLTRNNTFLKHASVKHQLYIRYQAYKTATPKIQQILTYIESNAM